MCVAFLWEAHRLSSHFLTTTGQPVIFIHRGQGTLGDRSQVVSPRLLSMLGLNTRGCLGEE